MSAICVIISVILTVFVLMMAQHNDLILNMTLVYTDKTYEISLLVVSLIIYSLGILSGVLLMMSSFFEAQSKYSKLRKQYDKTSIGADDAEDKIKLLENKIQTLEIALKKQMEK